MRVTPLAAAGALALGALAVAPAQAAIQNEGPGDEIAWVNNNVIVRGSNPDQAIITAKYRCSGLSVHLWASVKQGGNIGPGLPSSDAESWYETPEGPAANCDGKTHVEKFVVTRSTEGDFRQLRKGVGWVQLRFFYGDEENPFANRAGASGFGSVKAPKH